MDPVPQLVRILFVENHAVFAATVAAEFLADHEVTVVSTVAAARELLSEAAFEVVLLDYDLDDDKGDALVPDILCLDVRPKVIGISARPEGNAAILAAGADAVCEKLRFGEVGSLLADG